MAADQLFLNSDLNRLRFDSSNSIAPSIRHPCLWSLR